MTENGENERTSKFMNTNPSSAPTARLVFDQHVVGRLNQLASRNKLADNEAENVIEVLKQIKHEYTTSACMAKNTLQKLHLTTEQLSINTRKHLKEAVKCNQFRYFGQHPIKKLCSDSRIALEAAKLEMEESTIKRRIRAVTKSDSDIEEQIAVLQRELLLAKDEYKTLKKETDTKVHEGNVCNIKGKRIQDALQGLRLEMRRNGIPDETKYQTVLDNYEELNAMKIEVTQLQEEILKYNELPADMEQATKVLWEARQEHEQLLQQISNRINSAKINK